MFEQTIELIKQVSEDRGVPRNIREKCTESMDILKDDKQELDVRINTVITTMDEISNDPNLPMYTRTQIWNIVSLLESVEK